MKISEEKRERELNLRLNKNPDTGTQSFVEFDENLLLDVGFESGELDTMFVDLKLDEDNDKDDEVPEVEESSTQIGEKSGSSVTQNHVRGRNQPWAYQKLMDGQRSTDVVFTDPPYNVNYKGHGKDE